MYEPYFPAVDMPTKGNEKAEANGEHEQSPSPFKGAKLFIAPLYLLTSVTAGPPRLPYGLYCNLEL